MFRITAYVWGVAIAPFGADFKAVAVVPVTQIIAVDDETSFFGEFAHGGFDGVLTILQTAGDGLPKSGWGDAFEQENIERWRVDDNQH